MLCRCCSVPQTTSVDFLSVTETPVCLMRHGVLIKLQESSWDGHLIPPQTQMPPVHPCADTQIEWHTFPTNQTRQKKRGFVETYNSVLTRSTIWLFFLKVSVVVLDCFSCKACRALCCHPSKPSVLWLWQVQWVCLQQTWALFDHHVVCDVRELQCKLEKYP